MAQVGILRIRPGAIERNHHRQRNGNAKKWERWHQEKRRSDKGHALEREGVPLQIRNWPRLAEAKLASAKS
jgi:hypothetical protein